MAKFMGDLWTWRRDLTFLLVGISVIVAISLIIRVLPYLANDFFFEVGFDTGIYERLTSFYLSDPDWAILPAYPALPPSYAPYIDQVEPSMFVLLGMANQIIAADVNTLYRYYLPILVGALSVIFGFIAGRHLAGSNLAGILAAVFIAMSYVQVEASNEAFHRQILATLLIILSAVYFDRFLRYRKGKYMLISTILASGTVALHISATMLFVFLLIYAVIYFSWKRQKGCLRVVIISTISAFIFSFPAWLPRVDYYAHLIRTLIVESIWRSSTLPTGEGLWVSGGSIPILFWDYPHILIGYILIFAPLVALTVLSYFVLWKERRLVCAIPILSLFLWAYIGLWLFFGNRYLLDLDILICIIAPVAIIYLVKRYGNRSWKRYGIVGIAILVMVPNFYIVVDAQLNTSPYIVENIEGAEWIIENIDSENSVIFAPDYLSADIIQRGYTMAIWDYTLSKDSRHPSYVAEEFMLEAPNNYTFLMEFFNEYPEYLDKDIFVLWGEWDLDRPLVKTQELIPVEDYSVSMDFDLRYDGFSEILKVYEFVGPRS